MPTMVRAAMLLMTAALTFYSAGVRSERLAARLKPWHVVLFGSGSCLTPPAPMSCASLPGDLS